MKRLFGLLALGAVAVKKRLAGVAVVAAAVMQAAVFILAFLLSTGLTCNGKPLCEQPRDQGSEVSAP